MTVSEDALFYALFTYRDDLQLDPEDMESDLYTQSITRQYQTSSTGVA